MPRILLWLLLALFGSVPVLGDTFGERLKETVTGTVDIRQETQRKTDQWAEEKAQLEARYRSSKAKIESLEKQTALWSEKVAVLQERVGEFHRRIEESQRLEANLQEILEGIMNRLEAWVKEDLPFLPEEREERLRSLKVTLAHSESSAAERLRRLLEALLVECEYGDTVEVYEQEIEVDGEPVFASIFRLGRLSLFWQTPDGARVGEYDRAKDRWVELPRKNARNISAAMEMAEKRRPIELVRLPLGRISP